MKTIVEAGHYYACTGPSALSMRGWGIGREILGSQSDAGLALLVDDYHSSQSFIDPGDVFLGPNEAEAAAAIMLVEADYIFSEADIAGTAITKMVQLLEASKVKSRKGVFSAGGVRLGSIAAGDMSSFSPTCVFLDFLLVEEKTTLAGDQIVVLPKTFSSQQAQLSVVLSKLVLPNLSSYSTVFYGLDDLERSSAVYEEVRL
jgi:hypothetical protein